MLDTEAPHYQERAYAEPQTYVERLGVGVRATLEKLDQPPERPLSAEEREAFFAIDTGLVRGIYDRDLGQGIDTVDGVEGWYKEVPPSANFVLDYFTTPEGGQALAEFEAQYGVDDVTSGAEHQHVQVAQRLAVVGRLVGDDKTNNDNFKKLAAQSQKHTVAKINQALKEGRDLEDSEHVYISTQPDRIIDRVRQVQHMRSFLRAVRHDLLARGDMSDNTKHALLVSVDGLRQKATAQLGGLYPNVIGLYHQALLLRDIDPEYAQNLGGQLIELSQPMRHILEAAESDDDVEDRFAFTMDRWRNGVVQGPENTAFSDELEALEERLDVAGLQQGERTSAAFTPEEIAYLDSLKMGAEEIAGMARHWLRRNGILSEDTSDMFELGNWPSDSQPGQPRIGVAVGEFDNLAYKRGWIVIPRTITRNLRQQNPSGPALVVPHELQHAIDGITAEYGQRQVSVAGVAARNSVGVREGVGKQEENLASQTLFGEPLHQSTVYIKALRAWGETGSESAAIVAYAEQAAKEGNTSVDKKLSIAQNRVQRLIKAGVRAASGWNSQPLVYAEQVLIAEGLDTVSPQVRDIVAANSYLDLRLMARFHEFGLLATERYQPEVSPIQAVEEYLRQHHITGRA